MIIKKLSHHEFDAVLLKSLASSKQSLATVFAKAHPQLAQYDYHLASLDDEEAKEYILANYVTELEEA